MSSLTDEVMMKTGSPASTRHTTRLPHALVVMLLLAACCTASVAAQPTASSSRGRDLEAEMNALKAQMQRFELENPGPARTTEFDAMMKDLRARLDRYAPPSASLDARMTELRVRLDLQQAELAQMKRRNLGAGIAFALLCASFCALWAIFSNRRPGYWFVGGLFFNVFALFVALYHAREDALARQANAPGHSDTGTGTGSGGN
jgi:hypothetical protein